MVTQPENLVSPGLSRSVPAGARARALGAGRGGEPGPRSRAHAVSPSLFPCVPRARWAARSVQAQGAGAAEGARAAAQEAASGVHRPAAAHAHRHLQGEQAAVQGDAGHHLAAARPGAQHRQQLLHERAASLHEPLGGGAGRRPCGPRRRRHLLQGLSPRSPPPPRPCPAGRVPPRGGALEGCSPPPSPVHKKGPSSPLLSPPGQREPSTPPEGRGWQKGLPSSLRSGRPDGLGVESRAHRVVPKAGQEAHTRNINRVFDRKNFENSPSLASPLPTEGGRRSPRPQRSPLPKSPRPPSGWVLAAPQPHQDQPLRRQHRPTAENPAAPSPPGFLVPRIACLNVWGGVAAETPAPTGGQPPPARPSLAGASSDMRVRCRCLLPGAPVSSLYL